MSRRRHQPDADHPGSRRETRELTRSVTFWLVIIANVFLLGLFGLITTALLQPPTDAAIEESFSENDVAFEEIVPLLEAQDQPEGQARLRQTIESVGGVTAFTRDGSVHVVLYRSGSGANQVNKGVVRTSGIPHPVVDDTDRARERSEGAGRAHRHLRGNWYIEFVWGE